MKNETLSLLDKIKTGDESAFDILAKEYEGLTEAAVKRFLPSFDITKRRKSGVRRGRSSTVRGSGSV